MSRDGTLTQGSRKRHSEVAQNRRICLFSAGLEFDGSKRRRSKILASRNFDFFVDISLEFRFEAQKWNHGNRRNQKSTLETHYYFVAE